MKPVIQYPDRCPHVNKSRTAAREYLGTPFQHQGRLKGMACDCVGLPYMVAEELGLHSRDGKAIDKNENVHYQAQPTDNFVHQECHDCWWRSQWSMQEGDVVPMKMPTIPCHVGIVSRLYVGTPTSAWESSIATRPLRRLWRRSSTVRCRIAFMAVSSFPGVTD